MRVLIRILLLVVRVLFGKGVNGQSLIHYKDLRKLYTDSAAHFYLKGHKNLSSYVMQTRAGYLLGYGSVMAPGGFSTMVAGIRFAADYSSNVSNHTPGVVDYNFSDQGRRNGRIIAGYGVSMMVVSAVLIGFGKHYSKIGRKIKEYESKLSYSPEDFSAMKKLRVKSIVLHTTGNVIFCGLAFPCLIPFATRSEG